jgi:hypothetical protein
MKVEERNKRIYNLINGKMKYLFRETLTEIEKEVKQFDIKSSFFDKSKDKRPTGYYAIRKTLLDHGNNITELLRIILDEVELTPHKSVINIDPSLLRETPDGKS